MQPPTLGEPIAGTSGPAWSYYPITAGPATGTLAVSVTLGEVAAHVTAPAAAPITIHNARRTVRLAVTQLWGSLGAAAVHWEHAEAVYVAPGSQMVTDYRSWARVD